MNKKNKARKVRKINDFKIITVLYCICLLLVCIGYFATKIALGFDKWETFFDSLLTNVISLILTIVVFNFIYEYLVRKHIADAVGKQIIDTLMGNPKAMEVFDRKNKLEFIKSTVKSIVGEETYEMVNAAIDPYIDNSYNIRRFYKYTIILREYDQSKKDRLLSANGYWQVYENLQFKKTYIGQNKLDNELFVAFIMKNSTLDDALRNQKFMFQETLLINDSDFNLIKSLSPDKLRSFVESEMSFTCHIDDNRCQIDDISVSHDMIMLKLKSLHDTEIESHMIELGFSMPILKGHSEFLVSITEPTYSPLIQFFFPESLCDVKAFPFFNNRTDSSIERATRNIGTCEFYIKDKWIHPTSGVVFMIDKK